MLDSQVMDKGATLLTDTALTTARRLSDRLGNLLSITGLALWVLTMALVAATPVFDLQLPGAVYITLVCVAGACSLLSLPKLFEVKKYPEDVGR